jgi:hypothetical protein
LKKRHQVTESIYNAISAQLELVEDIKKSIAELLNKNLVPAIEKHFKVKAKAVVQKDPESTWVNVILLLFPDRKFKNVNEAYEFENKLWSLVDEFLVKRYPDIYPKCFSLLVEVEWDENS